MKKLTLILILLATKHVSLCKQINSIEQVYADSLQTSEEHRNNFNKKSPQRVNIFVFTYEKRRTLDFVALYTYIRVKSLQLLHPKKLYVINAKSSDDVALKLTKHLRKTKKMIGTIWFDSHGHYKNKYSSFKIGKNEFSFSNINNYDSIKDLLAISKYCDEFTSVAYGSCHGGSTLYFPGTDSTAPVKMNGDLLMIGLGQIFPLSTIYASQSWVMAKPGSFSNRYGMAGVPIAGKYRDYIYAPAWLNIGKWNRYNTLTNTVASIPTVALDSKGNLRVNKKDYFLTHPRRQEKTMAQSKKSTTIFTALKN